MHWAAGFSRGFKSHVAGPPPMTHLAVEEFTASKFPMDRFSSLETPFELALFSERLAGEEPLNYDGPNG